MGYKYEKIVIGIDQSYDNTGVSVFADGEKKRIKSVRLGEYKTNSDKRDILRQELKSVLRFCCTKSDNVICIIERIRLRSQGFVNIDYIKSIGALNSVIVDCCRNFSVNVFSVDTRCWKSQVIGTSKPAKNRLNQPEEKWPTINWCIKNGWESDIIIEITNKQKKKFVFERDNKRWTYNNDACDSAGIALFGFIGEADKLQKEH